MAKRRRMSRQKSKRMFSKTADRTHKKNMPGSFMGVMRGGYRL